MKKAVVVVGKHYAGKSRTIRQYLKPKLGMERDTRKFIRNGQDGYVLSQSFEEAKRDIQKIVNKYSHFDLLVLAARPANESPSCLMELIAELQNASYQVSTVNVVKTSNNGAYYEGKSDEIITYLDT
jgi:hypothetical protein